MAKYIEIDASEVPDWVRFDVLPVNDGQIVEVAYGNHQRYSSLASSGDPYKRITDRSCGRVTYYRLARRKTIVVVRDRTPSRATVEAVHPDADEATVNELLSRYGHRAVELAPGVDTPDVGERVHTSGSSIRVIVARASDEKCFGYTFSEWLAAAGRTDSAGEYDLRAAWRAGEEPSEYEHGDGS